MKKEIRIRGILKRTKKNFKLRPTSERAESIQRLEICLSAYEFHRECIANPDKLITLHDLLRRGLL